MWGYAAWYSMNGTLHILGCLFRFIFSLYVICSYDKYFEIVVGFHLFILIFQLQLMS